MRFVYVQMESDDEKDMLLAEEAARIFSTREIRLHRRYDGFILAMEGEETVGAVALAPYPSEDRLEFSVAVHPKWERKGIAKKLVLAALEWARRYLLPSSDGAVLVECEVVNEVAMPPLLRALGFWNVRQNEWEKTIGAR